MNIPTTDLEVLEGKQPEAIQQEQYSALLQEIKSKTGVKALARALDSALTATKPVMLDKEVSVDVPDHVVRLKAVELMLAYLVGKPITRSLSVVQTQNVQPTNDELAEMLKSPHFAAELEKMIEQAKAIEPDRLRPARRPAKKATGPKRPVGRPRKEI